MRFRTITGTTVAATVAAAGLAFSAAPASAQAEELPTCDRIWGVADVEISDEDGDGEASPGDVITMHATVENATGQDVDMKGVEITYTDARGDGGARYTLEGSEDDTVLEAGGYHELRGTSTIQEGDFSATDPVILETDGWEVPGHDCMLVLDRVAFEGDLSAPEPHPEDWPELPGDDEDGPIVDTGRTGADDTAAWAGVAGTGLLLAGAATLGATRLRRST